MYTVPIGLFTSALGSAGNDPNAQAIYGNLVAWWTLNDSANTPTYIDSFASHNMTLRSSSGTLNTSTLSVGGGIGGSNASGMGGSPTRTAYVPRADTVLDLGDFDFTFGGWFKTQAAAATTAFLMGRVGGHANGVFNQLRAWIFIDNDTFIKARYSSDGSNLTATANSGIAFSNSINNLCVMTYDKTGGRLHLRIGNQNGSITHANVALGAAIATANVDTNFTIGAGLQNDSVTDLTTNREGVFTADECFVANLAMTDAQFTYMTNSGSGKTFTQLVADQ